MRSFVESRAQFRFKKYCNKEMNQMRKIMAGLVLLLFSLQAASAFGQKAKYPPLSEYMMAQDLEIALAKSAAPENISSHATIKVLTASGFQAVHDGDNG